MPKNDRYLKYKLIGIGVSVLFIFVLILVLTRPRTGINTDQKSDEPAHELTTLIHTGSDSNTEQVSAELTEVDVPLYDGEPYVLLNEDVPLFTEEEIKTITGITYSELDKLGRCGPAYGQIGKETIPQEQRGPIGDVRPSGWQTVRYDDLIEDRYLYNRCHLIGYQLAGANAEVRNLITGTRYLNTAGMLPIENQIYEYVTGTGNHVLYRVTPIFEEDNLVASGVVIEAYSVEDKGKGIKLCRYLFNVQPGVIIDYKTGDSQREETYQLELTVPENETIGIPVTRQMPADEIPDDITYVLNINTMRFHDPSCPSVEDMKEKNRRNSSETRDVLIAQGYKPCARCTP